MNKNKFLLTAASAAMLLYSFGAQAQGKDRLADATRKPGPAEQLRLDGVATAADNLPRPLKTKKAKAANNTADFYGRTLYGALINSNTWSDATITNVPYGIYSFEMGDSPAPESHITDIAYGFTSAAYTRDKVFGIAALSVMGAFNGARYITIDTKNWKETGNILFSPDKKTYSLLPSAMAYNPIDNTLYSMQYKDDLSGLDWCKYNFEYGEMDKIASFRGKFNVLTLAAVPDGDMYFINSYGDLYTVNKTNGRFTLVGFTGVTPLAYSQSMAYDNRTGKFLWAAWTAEGSKLYAVDPATAEAEEVLSFKNNEQFTALYSTDNEAPDAAPAAVGNLKLAYNGNGSLEGTISFDVPSTTFDGRPLGESTLNVWVDGSNIAGTAVTAGTKASYPVTLTEGNHYVAVNLSNGKGHSPTGSLYQYAGYDVPLAVAKPDFKYDEKTMENSVTWTRPQGGVNGGYIDFDNLTYTVVRMPDSTTVATGLKETSFHETTPDEMHSYSYRVTAVNNGKQGAWSESDKVIAGKAFTAPYKQSFADKGTFADFFTVVDANNDGNTWREGYSNDVRIDLNDAHPNGDDYLITPAIALEGGTVYRYTVNMKTFTKGYPEFFEVLVGTDPDDVSTFKSIKKEDNFEMYDHFDDYSTNFIAEETGKYYLALRYLGDASKKSSMLMLNSVAVDKVGQADAPAAVSNLKITPDADNSMKAEISFDAPKTNLKGGNLASIDKIEVLRKGATEPVHTFNAPSPGEALSFTDNGIRKVGTNTWSVIAYNGSGAGEAAADSAFVGIYTAPYLESFDTREASELYTATVDGFDTVASPYYVWTWDSNNKRMKFYSFNANDGDRADLWLYTPAMKLDANSVYEFSYKTQINLYSETITNKVYMGAEATPESQSVFVGDMPRTTGYGGLVKVSHNVVTEDAGKFVFGFNSLSEGKNDYNAVDLDDISLTYKTSALSPYGIKNFKAEADKNGENAALLSFNAPSTDWHGSDLTGFVKVEIFRGQAATPIYSNDNVSPGEKIEYNDTEALHGKNVYNVVVSNTYGSGESLADTLFVGADVPDAVGNLSVRGTADNQGATRSWEAPAEGVNGGVVIDKDLTYNVYSYNAEENTITPIEKGVKGTSYTVKPDPSDKQEMFYYAVSAANGEGEGQASAASVVLGKLYTLPFKESFAGMETATTPWQNLTTDSYRLNWGVTNPDGSSYNKALPQDNDGGVAYMYNGNQYEVYAGAAFISPKTSLGGKTATLKFWVYNVPTAYPSNAPELFVYVRADDGDYAEAAHYVVGSGTEDGWKQYEISLEKFATSDFISLAFYGYTCGYQDVIYLDNIEIAEGLPTSIGETVQSGKKVRGVSYFDAAGRAVSRQDKGVKLRTVTYSDGTHKTIKTIGK